MSTRLQQLRFKKWRAEHRLSPETLEDWITITFEMLQAEDMLKTKTMGSSQSYSNLDVEFPLPGVNSGALDVES